MPGLWAQLGGFGNVDFAYLLSPTSNFTLTDNNSAQKAFNIGTNSALTLLAGQSYLFEASYAITNTGTTAHTWAVLLGGTATFSAGSVVVASGCTGITAGTPAAGGLQGFTTTPGTAMVVTASSTSATEQVSVFLSGRLNVNAGGTIIPQVQLSAATTGTEVMLAGSFFRIWGIGPSSVTTIGPAS